MQTPRRAHRVTRRVALFAATAVALATLASIGPGIGDAQTNDEIESIREERRQVEAETAAKAKEVEAADVELEQLSATLLALGSAVNAQEGRVANAQLQLDEAERTLIEAEAAVDEGEQAIADLRRLLADRAITSFVNQGTGIDTPLFVSTDDPNLALRMQVLVDRVTQADVDVVDVLRAAEEDLEVERAVAVEAAARATELRASMESELAILEENRGIQAELTAAAEDRLDHLLSERAALQALGVQLAADQRAAEDALAAELARRANPSPGPSGPGGPAPPVATPDEIVNVGRGIWVHQSIADNIRRLLADASAAGVEFAGGGYRDPSGQIRVRRNNCGTSDYAIYQMPASQCRPPTARPGTSMHERGLAIDFTINGRIIGSRSGPGWNWLRANAASYGLFNLPSEPWHWSTTGG